MTNEPFRILEDNLTKVQDLQHILVGQLISKTGQGHFEIERALYLTSVTCVSRPGEVALIVNQFLGYLRAMTEPVQLDEEQEPPFLGRQKGA